MTYFWFIRDFSVRCGIRVTIPVSRGDVVAVIVTEGLTKYYGNSGVVKI